MANRSLQGLDVSGLRFRSFKNHDDFEVMASVSQRNWAADDVEWVTTAENIAHGFAGVRDHDPTEDVLFAEIDGEIVGYGALSWDSSEENPKSYGHSIHVLPEWRGKGIREAMFLHNECRIKEIASAYKYPTPQRIVLWA